MDLRESYKKDIIFLTEEILSTVKLVIYNDNLYIYKDKCYEYLDEIKLLKLMQNFFIEKEISDLWNSQRALFIKKTILGSKNVPIVKMNEYSGLLNLNNGILNLDTKTLLPHSSEYYFDFVLDVNYNLEAQSPINFITLMRKMFEDENGETDDPTIAVLMMIGGYLLYPSGNMNKFFIFLGEGANGKSILLYAYQMFFNPAFITSMSLKALSEEKNFSREGLIYSRVNVSSEEGGYLVSEEIKKIVSGETINVARKNKLNLDIKPKTKLIVAANNDPKFGDSTHGIKRRMVLVNFPNRFEPEHKYKKIENPTAKRIFVSRNEEEIKAELHKEKEGIFILFLKMLEKLKSKNWILPDTVAMQEVYDDYTESLDSVKTFLKENYEESEFHDTPVKDVYDHLRVWYKENVSEKSSYPSKDSLSKKIVAVFRVKSKIARADGVTVRTYNLKRKTENNNEIIF